MLHAEPMDRSMRKWAVVAGSALLVLSVLSVYAYVKLFLCDFASPTTALAHLAALRTFLERRLESYERLAARAASPRRYPEHVLQHGLARIRATLAGSTPARRNQTASCVEIASGGLIHEYTPAA